MMSRLISSSSPPRPRASLASVAGASVIAAIACAPKVHEFHTNPHDLCPGTAVAVTWRVEGGTPSVKSSPPLEPQSGQTYLPPTSTKFILSVKPLIGAAVEKESVVRVFSGTPASPEPDKLGFQPKCDGAVMVQEIDRPFSEWDQRLIVGALATTSNRFVTVEHEGRQATLTPTIETNVFDGARLGGSWRISVPLLPSETCGGTGDAPPRIVTLIAHVRCGS